VRRDTEVQEHCAGSQSEGWLPPLFRQNRLKDRAGKPPFPTCDPTHGSPQPVYASRITRSPTPQSSLLTPQYTPQSTLLSHTPQSSLLHNTSTHALASSTGPKRSLDSRLVLTRSGRINEYSTAPRLGAIRARQSISRSANAASGETTAWLVSYAKTIDVFRSSVSSRLIDSPVRAEPITETL